MLHVACTEMPVDNVANQISAQQRVNISWQEHIIDGPTIAGFDLTGGDGLVMGDVDRDGFEDIVSVHESDAEYDSAEHTPGFVAPKLGYVRIAFGSNDPNTWTNLTLAEGEDSPAPEDAALADVNGDGYLDVIVAAELSHLLYLQNPGALAQAQNTGIRSSTWPRLILPMTKGRGSYIRAFFADFDGDGRPEIAAANKGSQTPGPEDYKKKTPVMIYQIVGDPLSSDGWREIELGQFIIPQNSEPVDIDGDGDLDIVVGSRGEARLILFENTTDANTQQELTFHEHKVEINKAQMGGFNLEYVDLNSDGRLDIIGAATHPSASLIWIEQPQSLSQPWHTHPIGDFSPDILVGLESADIDGDGDMDLLAGGYSRGKRTMDTQAELTDPMGRISWFENPGAPSADWTRHDISRRQRGMFDKFIARDLDNDGDMDFIGTRGNSGLYDGVFWLEQLRTNAPLPVFKAARANESREMPLPVK